ncbi:SMP-30/gluconolactonase/LRE family protein (plasmid) [Achromobacter denitrificans]
MRQAGTILGRQHERRRPHPFRNLVFSARRRNLRGPCVGYHDSQFTSLEPRREKMYFADTPAKRIQVYDFDTDDGVPHNPRTFLDMSEHAGRPDGATVDVDGCLWSAHIHSGQVVRYTPKGRQDRVIQLPVTGVTSCAFGERALTRCSSPPPPKA